MPALFDSVRNRPVPVRMRTGRRPDDRNGLLQEMAENCAFFRLARLMLNRPAQGFHLVQGVSVMAKFENFAFAVGLALTGLLSLAAVPLA